MDIYFIRNERESKKKENVYLLNNNRKRKVNDSPIKRGGVTRARRSGTGEGQKKMKPRREKEHNPVRVSDNSSYP